jgi:nicotinate phosphoribosyltransferase
MILKDFSLEFHIIALIIQKQGKVSGMSASKPKMVSGFLNSNNMALALDHYQITMAGAYFTRNLTDLQATFNLFVRKLPKNRNYLIAAGLEQCLHYLENIQFKVEHIEWLRKKPEFKDVDPLFFEEYLPNFRFTGMVRAIPEGTVVFPNEPILEVTAPIIEAQIVETFLLSKIVGQTTVASKAARVVSVANSRPVIDFGMRRAHDPQAAVFASRACYIGGCEMTSNDLAGYFWDIPVTGTMAHSFIQVYENDYSAFQDYVSVYPSAFTALIDTYDTIYGTISASKFQENLRAVRIDSGNLIENSFSVRSVLDQEGCFGTKIFVTSDLNEYKIKNLLDNQAPIDAFGVGTEMIVSRDDPTLSAVYKLVEFDNKPKIKLSQGKIRFMIF